MCDMKRMRFSDTADAERRADWPGGLVVIDGSTTFGKLAYSENLLTDLLFILIDA